MSYTCRKKELVDALWELDMGNATSATEVDVRPPQMAEGSGAATPMEEEDLSLRSFD